MLKVLHPGMHTTIQDMGRFGYRYLGVPVSGTMDSISAKFANALLNNHKNDAVLEITMVGPKLLFMASTAIVVSGAEISAKLNDNPISNYKVYRVNRGDILSFGKLINGVHCYLAVTGGFQTALVLKSRSFYAGITVQGIIKKDDLLSFHFNEIKNMEFKGALNIKNPFFDSDILTVLKGPEFDLFTSREQERLLSGNYTISNRINRMGYRIEEVVVAHSKSIITSPVLPGTVQLVPSGELIILMKDAQTTGGYPRIFQLTEKAIAILAQKRSGDRFKFNLTAYL